MRISFTPSGFVADLFLVEERANREEDAAPVWPPRIANPPRLPFSSDEPLGLSVDEDCRPPELPEFTPGRMAAKAGTKVVPDAAPAAVIYDRKNPSGRTRGDRVLRPTDEDRVNRLMLKRRNAALMAASAAGMLVFILISPPLAQWLLVVAAGALSGWLAYDLGDSEVSWAGSMGLVGIPAGFHHDLGGVFVALLFMAAAGWFIGFVRDAEMS